jgi:uncharacterized iron-regulated membrane protein
MKRLLFEVHRWLGIVVALFMVLWFLSGLVIVYAGSLNQGKLQQRAHGEVLAPQASWLSLGEALERSADERKQATRPQVEGRRAGTGAGRGEASFAEARLVRHGGVPVWLVEDGRGRGRAISALDGSLHQADANEALAIATAWTGHPASALRHVDTADSFATLRNSEEMRPVHRVTVDDGAGRELLISARTGEVLQDSTRVDRAMYWAGNWLHVFRFFDMAGWGGARHDVLAWVSGIALVATLTGLVIGWLRWRPGWFGKPTYAEGRTQPYRAFWFRWHFWSGLIGGTAALLWAFSGFLNNNPGQIFSSGNGNREELARYQGGAVPARMLEWRPSPLADDIAADTVELSWHRLGDEAILIAHDRNGRRLAMKDAGQTRFSALALAKAFQRLAGDAQVSARTLLKDYDSYYYARPNRSTGDRPLPVIRIDINDEAGTRAYIDPLDGRLLLKQDASRRAFRWFFSALHHWDFGWLRYRPLWDVWMIAWCLLGLVLSVSATVVGWRRLARTFSRRKDAKMVAAVGTRIAVEARGE